MLHAASAHPAALVHSIPYAQYIRLCCNCTHIADFLAEGKLLHARLLARGYSKSFLRKAYNKDLKQPRNTLLYPKNSSSSETKPTLRIITWFSSQHQEVRNILNNHWHILQQDSIVKKHVGTRPEITFRWASSLCVRLVLSHYSSALNSGARCHRCGNCNFCPWLCEDTAFTLPNGEICFP